MLKLTRFAHVFLALAILSGSAAGQFERDAGKIVARNGIIPATAGNGKIMFLRADDKIPGNPVELFSKDLKTGEEKRVLPGFDFKDQPTYTYAVSPDGSEFAVQNLVNGTWELFVYKVGERTGRQVSQLAQFREDLPKDALEQLGITPADQVAVADLSWSPSGKRLIFTLMRPGKASVWWLELATGRTRQATEDLVGYYPSFHPNDDRFCYTEPVVKEGITNDEDLVLRSIASGDVDTITTSRDHEFAGQISPDGKYIAYCRKIQETNNIFIMNIATKEARALTHSNNDRHCAFPKWSPDGKKIYFQGNNFINQPLIFERDFVPF